MIEIKPINNLNATIVVPSSKSYTNRSLITTSLAEGESKIKDPLFSDDTIYMINALSEFGVMIKRDGETLLVEGTNGKIRSPQKEIFLGNSGTAMRFLTTFAGLAPGRTVLNGDERMNERPIQDLLDGLRGLGVKAYSRYDTGSPPVVIEGGTIIGGKTTLRGGKSSQYLTSIMLCAPYAERDIEIDLVGELTSRPYIDMTIDIMREFDVHVEKDGYKRFIIRRGQRYHHREYSIEGDASNASYFFAAAAVTGGRVKITNLNPFSAQGDTHLLDILEKMGCKVIRGNDYIEVIGGKLKGITVDMNSMPDMVQTLAVISLFAEGETRITNISNLRIKETDRIKALSAELIKVGGIVEELEDGISIIPSSLHGAEIKTYNDHRMAMSFSITGLKVPGIKIDNPECVSKSFPDFFERLKGLY
ncbi:MAG: 3-phosphoshikimate 1-carboxyvinyltransferase [Nitrospinae bacterium]|nr:3-phosphoshikimate 1-carboxyvinyltransferase [Nitrospinota bacterium]